MATWGEPNRDSNTTADLEKLAAELDGREYAVTLVTSGGRAHLRITNRAASQLTEDVFAGNGYFWWGWAERLCPVTDVATAAVAVRKILRGAGEER